MGWNSLAANKNIATEEKEEREKTKRYIPKKGF